MRPNDTVLVVAALNGGSHYSFQTNAVAAHDDRNLLAIGI